MTMSLVQTVTVGPGGASSIVFSNIPSTATDLVIQYSFRGVNAADDYVVGYFNNATYAGARKELRGNGASVSSTSGSIVVGYLNNAGATANTFSNCEIYIPNYTSNIAKTISSESVTENANNPAYQTCFATTVNLIVPINQIQLSSQNGNLAQYSMASLYTITKA